MIRQTEGGGNFDRWIDRFRGNIELPPFQLGNVVPLAAPLSQLVAHHINGRWGVGPPVELRGTIGNDIVIDAFGGLGGEN